MRAAGPHLCCNGLPEVNQLAPFALLQDIIHNRDTAGQVTKWAAEIGAHNIKYEPPQGSKIAGPCEILR
jgi:hypothetical protein